MVKIEKEFVLFISPYESISCKWEMKQFPDMEKMDKYIFDADLTKDFFGLPVVDLIKYCKNVKHPKIKDEQYLIINENGCFYSSEYDENATTIVAFSKISEVLTPFFDFE